MVGLLTILTILVGAYSITKLDAELMPEVDFDGAYVAISAGDMATIEVERQITTPLERAILGIEGVEDVFSTTMTGMSNIQIMIEQGRGEEVSKEIQTTTTTMIANISGVTDVIAEQMSLSQSYEFFMDISDGDMNDMTRFAEEVLEPRLEDLPEVKDVALMGIQEYEMVISFNKDRLTEHGLDSNQVISIIQQANTDATLGEFTAENEQPAIRFETNLSSEENIENIKIPTQNGLITVSDIAQVSLEPMETSSYVWKEGSKDFIFVQVGRSAGVTQIEMADAVRTEIQKIKDENLVDGFTVNELVAQADYVEDSINGITENIIIGGIIAILILLVYLRNIRATVIIAISIPTSILLTFMSIWMLGYSFNMMTLVALGLGVGMMVDSSIVILESIFKKKEIGLDARQAVLEGTREVSSAVIASILTTIVVFIPIGLMSGDVGQFMVILFAVVSVTLISSLLVAFTIIPALSEKFLKAPKKKVKEGKLLRIYDRIISWIVKRKRHSLAMVVIFIVMFAGSVFLLFKIPMTIMPDMLNRYTEILVELEPGITPNEKEELVSQATKELNQIDDVDTSYIMDDGTLLFMLINMTKDEDITREQKEVNEEILRSLRGLTENYPIVSVERAMVATVGQPVQIQVKGEEFDQLLDIANSLKEELSDIEGLVGINTSMERTSIEKVVELDSKKMDDAGISELQLRGAMEEAFLQMPISEISTDDRTVPLVVKWKDEVVSEAELLEWKIPTAQGEESLGTFIDLQSVEVPNEISHLDGERYITVSADIENTDLGTVNREIQQLLSDFETPNGYTVSTGGDIETQQELIYDLALILVISVFLVYLVMAVQFNNLAHPLIVMSTIPMAFIGVVVGLFATQRELSIMSAMGILMLFGIVLNNAILLIDRTNQLRRKGMSVNEAIVSAGKDRIRPIFMTTFTTVGGMMPLALATGTTGNYQAPMATAIISGLLFATMITLVLIPAVYRLFHSFGNGIRKLFKRERKNKVIESTNGPKPIELVK